LFLAAQVSPVSPWLFFIPQYNNHWTANWFRKPYVQIDNGCQRIYIQQPTESVFPPVFPPADTYSNV